MSTTDSGEIRSEVRQRYGSIAERVRETGGKASCCGPSSDCCSPSGESQVITIDDIQAPGYGSGLPVTVTGASLGCGNPTGLAGLKPGEVVLDLGSGGGIDVFLAAQRVGPAGRAIGVDMTPEMIDLARANARKVGATNVEFRLGEIEALPVADGSVDVILSNCVVNLSPDKDAVFREAFRVLRPGGRVTISDIVTSQPLPESVRRDMEAWAGCLAGALEEQEYLGKMRAAGFADARVVERHTYFDASQPVESPDLAGLVDNSSLSEENAKLTVSSVTVVASKPPILES